jgi:hypothetical protein
MDFQGCAYSSHDDFPDITSEFSTRIEQIEVLEPMQIFNINNLYKRR